MAISIENNHKRIKASGRNGDDSKRTSSIPFIPSFCTRLPRDIIHEVMGYVTLMDTCHIYDVSRGMRNMVYYHYTQSIKSLILPALHFDENYDEREVEQVTFLFFFCTHSRLHISNFIIC